MDRVPMQARVSEAAYLAWDRWLATEGVSFTATVEALGEALATGKRTITAGVIKRAREIDRERHTYRRRR